MTAMENGGKSYVDRRTFRLHLYLILTEPYGNPNGPRLNHLTDCDDCRLDVHCLIQFIDQLEVNMTTAL